MAKTRIPPINISFCFFEYFNADQISDLRTAGLWPVGLGLVGGDAAEVDNAGVLLAGVRLDVVSQRLHHEAVAGHVHPEIGKRGGER